MKIFGSVVFNLVMSSIGPFKCHKVGTLERNIMYSSGFKHLFENIEKYYLVLLDTFQCLNYVQTDIGMDLHKHNINLIIS